MQNVVIRWATAIFIAMSVCLGAVDVAAGTDTVPPAFQSLAVSPATVVAGNTITITTRITDNDVGVGGTNRPFIYYNGPAGQFLSAYFSFISGSAQDGIWQAFLTIPATYPSGTYTVNLLGASDVAGNTANISPPTPPTPNGVFAVTGGSNDTTPPVFQSLSVSPSTVVAGNTITITTRITDNNVGVSGTNRPFIYYDGPSGQFLSAYFSFISGTAQDGMWQAFLSIPSSYPSGTYTVNLLGAYDAAGNAATVSPPTPPTPNGTFAVSGGSNDTTPPAFQSLSVSPKAITAGNTITITARITDGSSGVSGTNRPFIYYNGPAGQFLSAYFSFISGTAQDGTWQALLTIPASYPVGSYTVNLLGASDAAGNSTNISPPTPPTPDGAFNVVSPVQAAPPARPAPPAPSPPSPIAPIPPSRTGVTSPDSTLSTLPVPR